MNDIILASAQFEHHSNDKAYNLKVIEELSIKARNQQASMNYQLPGILFFKALDGKS
jgi:hypothetical protein